MLTITSRKYDGSFSFSTEVSPLYVSHDLVLAVGQPGRRVRRRSTELTQDNWSLEYLPLDKPYNIVSFFDPSGAVQFHFCNVLAFPQLRGANLDYVDLDLDVRVLSDGRYVIEDRCQFEENAMAMGYPPRLRALALDALGDLTSLAEQGGHVLRCETLDEARDLLLAVHTREA